MGMEPFESIVGKCYGQLWAGQASCRVESEWTLPDYKEAARRLLRVDADPRITGKNLYQKGQEWICEVEGELSIGALYQPEGEGGEETVSSYVATESFFYTFHAPLSSDGIPDQESVASLCEGMTENLSARLLGPRRVSFRCDVALSLSLRGNREIACLSGQVPPDVEVKTETRETTVLAGVVRQDLELREILTLPASYLPIREMTDMTFSLFADRVRVSDGTVQFTGRLTVNAAYAPEGESGVVSFCQPLEFEKSIGTGLAAEGDLCEVALIPTSFQSSVELSEGGENKDLAIEVLYTAEIRLYRREKISFITDLYSVKDELEIHSKNETLSVYTAIRDFTKEIHAELPLKHTPFSHAEDVRAAIRFLDNFRDGRKLTVKAELQLKYLTVTESGAVSAAEDALEIRFDLPDVSDVPEGEGKVELWGGVSDAQLTLREDVIDVRLEVFGRLVLSREESVQYVAGADVKEALQREKPGILFYYPDGEEDLWDVCKKFKARVASVRGENQWEGEGVPPVVRIIRS
ncbi:MAG: hypothetical protein J6Z79_07415 [Clostridia bacterium]|nr:hypothetical protein [Clostridia bacterium]